MTKTVPNTYGNDKSHKVIGGAAEILESASGKNCSALLKAWEKLIKSNPNDQGIPYRSDLNPRTIKPILPYLILLDSIQGGKDYTVRLFGTACVDFFGKDITNLTLSETQLEDYKYRIDLYNQILKSKKPIFAKWPTQRILGFSNLPEEENSILFSAFPLLDKKGDATKIILGFDFLV